MLWTFIERAACREAQLGIDAEPGVRVTSHLRDLTTIQDTPDAARRIGC